MRRSPTARGRPAFGWADSGTVVTSAMRSIAFEHGGGADRAVEADDVGAPLGQPGGDGLHRGAVGRVPVLAHGHLRDDRQIRRHGPRGLEGGMDLLQVAEGLQDESVHPALGQSSGLQGEMGHGLAPRGRAPRLDPDAERADGADHHRPSASGLPGQSGGTPVDVLGALLQPEGRQLHRIGAEGVGLDDLGAGPEVGLVDLLHQAGLLQGQLVVADVDEHPAVVQHRAHRAVEDVNTRAGDEIAKSRHAPSRRHRS